MKTKRDIENRIEDLKRAVEFYHKRPHDNYTELVHKLEAIIFNLEWVLREDG